MNKWNFKENRICELLGIQFPIIQAGMVWCSGWKLAFEVSDYGALGTIGAGSMTPDVLKEHIQKIKSFLGKGKPFAVNLPLLYSHIHEHIQVVIENEVPIVITSAGNPKTWTGILKERGIKVVIAGAGLAAHLPGVIAAYTTLPVIGVPLKSGSLNGLDSLLSIVNHYGFSTCGFRGMSNTGGCGRRYKKRERYVCGNGARCRCSSSRFSFCLFFRIVCSRKF